MDFCNNEPDSTLSPVQAQIVAALVEGHTITAAVARVGVHRATFYRWLNTEREFQSAVEQARAEHNLTVDDQLVEMSALALSTVREFLQDPSIPKPLRLRAALAFLGRPRAPRQEWALPKPEPICARDLSRDCEDAAEPGPLVTVRSELQRRKLDPL